MIDCLKCYRLRRHNDTVYCPFLDLKECVRGEHYINIASLPFKPQKGRNSSPAAENGESNSTV